MTIARLIRDLEADRRNLSGSLLVIDESSMLDLQMYERVLVSFTGSTRFASIVIE